MVWPFRKYTNGFRFSNPPVDVHNLGGVQEPDWTHAFPNLKDLAKLSEHVYSIPNLLDGEDFPKIDDGWECIATGVHNEDGYCGAAYLNKNLSQIVIAHKGTRITSWKDVFTDWNGIVRNKNASQISTAYIFTKLVVNQFHDKVFSISVTGHSLGGWLAQICALYIEYPDLIYDSENALGKDIDKKEEWLTEHDSNLLKFTKSYIPYHLHTVVFDSPGCRSALLRIIGGRYKSEKKIECRVKAESLDITVVIAPSNIINTHGEHVGQVIHLPIQGVPEYSHKFKSHDIARTIVYLSSPNPEVFEVCDAHRGKAVELGTRLIYKNWYIGYASSCRVSVFSSQEQEFLKYAQVLLQWKKERRDSRGNTSEEVIFNSDYNRDTRSTLDKLETEGLAEFICGLRIEYERISVEFPEGSFDSEGYRMPKFIWHVRNLFKSHSDWTSVLYDTIKTLPTCVKSICLKASFEYLELIPKLRNDINTQESLTIKQFLEHGTQHVLNPGTPRNGKRRTRMCMIQVVHCLRNGLPGMSKESILFLSTFQLQSIVSSCGIHNLLNESNFKLLVIECDSGIDSKTRRSITQYVKLILVFSNDLEYYPNAGSSSSKTSLNYNFDMTIFFVNLTESSQAILKSCKVEIQGDIISLGKINGKSSPFLLEDVSKFFGCLPLFASSELICDIFDGEGIKLVGGNLPNMASHYIPRRFYQINLDISKLKENLQKISDVIVVSNYKGEWIRSCVGEACFTKIVWREGQYSKEEFLKDYKSGNAHWFRQQGNNLIWQISKGIPCSECLKYSGEINELDILNLPNDMIVLADEPGMGKSASIINLFLKHREMQMMSNGSAYNLGVYIDLHDFQLDLKNCDYSDDLKSEFLSKTMRLKNEISSKLLRFLLEKSGPITFFIDSFDEISKSGQDFILKLLKILRSGNKYLRIFIATRNYTMHELERALKTKAYNFHRISTDDQILYLANYWAHEFLGDKDVVSIPRTLHCTELAKSFGKRAVEEIKSLLGENDTFIGIPLQLVCLATIHNHGFGKLAEKKLRISQSTSDPTLYTGRDIINTTNVDPNIGTHSRHDADNYTLISESDWEEYSHKFSSTLELYERFVNQKLEIWLDEKLGFERRSVCLDKNQKSWMNEMLCQAAYLYLSSSHFKSFNCSLPSEYPNEENCEDINMAGLCETILEWRKTIHIPENMIKRLSKTRNVQNAEDSNIVFLTLRDKSVDFEQVQRLLKGFISGQVVFGNENEFKELCSDHRTTGSCKHIHWFVEDCNSNFLFGQVFNSENGSTEFPIDSTVSKSYEISYYSYRFIHQTLAEFFMAKCLVSLIEIGENHKDVAITFLKLHYHEDYFAKIRYFLDSFLCTDIPALENLEIFKIPSLILSFDKGLSDNDWTREDSLGRNILHYAVAYGNYFIDGIFWMIAKNLELFHRKDKLDASCLSYLFLTDHIRQSRYYLYHMNSTTETYLRKSSLYAPLILIANQAGFNGYKYDQINFCSELFYSIFIGTIYCSVCSNYNSRSLTRYISDLEREVREKLGDVSYKKFKDKLNFASSQLKKKLEINIRWLLNCNWHRVKAVGFLQNLFLHNSHDTLSGTMDINVSEWVKYCLDEANERGYSLAADIFYCYGSNRYGSAFGETEINVNDRVLQILKENLEVNYDNMFQYMTADDEYLLWKSCTDDEKRIMFKIIKKYKFYSILRVGTWTFEIPRAFASFINVLTSFIESDKDSTDLKNALVWTFQIGIGDVGCYCIWNASDECTRKRLVNDNFKYVGPNKKQSAPPISDDDFVRFFSGGGGVNWKRISKTCLDTTNNIFISLHSHFEAKQREGLDRI